MKSLQPKKTFGILKIVVVSILFLALTQIYVSHRLATAGKLVGKLEEEAEKIRMENGKIKELVSQKGSLSVVFEKAEKLGFTPVGEVFYLTSEIPVALGR